jgi:putative tryptophan/tyrosine transport system substrate-binding protein
LVPDGLSFNIPGFILEAAAQQAIPTMFQGAFWVEQGGLASYGPDFYDMARQAACLVDKILKGADPAEIPVEVNPKLDLLVDCVNQRLVPNPAHPDQPVSKVR